MIQKLDATEVGVLVARALERHSIPYALGGALAYGQFAVPRATNDVDVNVFLEPEALSPLFSALQEVGASFDEARCRSEAASEGWFSVQLGAMHVDVFVPSIEFSWEAQRRRVRRPLGDFEPWFLSAESLCVFKLLFFRGKDLVDLERLVATQQRNLDLAWVRKNIVEMMGEGDPRVKTWDQLVADFA